MPHLVLYRERYNFTSSSAVTDEPGARRAASRQTAKFYNTHATIHAHLGSDMSSFC